VCGGGFRRNQENAATLSRDGRSKKKTQKEETVVFSLLSKVLLFGLLILAGTGKLTCSGPTRQSYDILLSSDEEDMERGGGDAGKLTKQERKASIFSVCLLSSV
jgi:hypothetical protein